MVVASDGAAVCDGDARSYGGGGEKNSVTLIFPCIRSATLLQRVHRDGMAGPEGDRQMTKITYTTYQMLISSEDGMNPRILEVVACDRASAIADMHEAFANARLITITEKGQ